MRRIAVLYANAIEADIRGQPPDERKTAWRAPGPVHLRNSMTQPGWGIFNDHNWGKLDDP
jgi:hypothetical protein